MSEDNKRDYSTSFPSNSHRSRQQTEQPKKVEKVVTGKVTTRKKSFIKRIVETFVGEDVGNVSSYVLYDVLIPAAKSTISEIFHGSIEMIFGETKRGINRGRRDNGRSYISYDRISSRPTNRSDERRDFNSRSRAGFNFNEIYLSSRGEADEVLNNLVDLVLDYRQATVADLYDLVGIQSNYTDTKYGWYDLSSASHSRMRNGEYILNLPRPVLLD